MTNDKKIDDGGPAFPTNNAGRVDPQTWHFEGMTLRDYFAAKAINVADSIENNCGTRQEAESALGLKPGEYKVAVHFPILVARRAYAIADAMIAARAL